MRAYLVSSIAVGCAAALALPLSLAAPAAAAPAAVATVPSRDADVAGSTQSLPLEPLASEGPSRRAVGSAVPDEQGLTRRDVRPFSLVGVVWDDARAPLRGTVQVRTRAAADGAWSSWQDVETRNDEHGADPDTAEGRSTALRGATAPLWVGDSDGVEVRVRPEPRETERTPSTLPPGLRLELVDPGPEPPEPGGQGGQGGPGAATSHRALVRTGGDGEDETPAAPSAAPSTAQFAQTAGQTADQAADQAAEQAAGPVEKAAESAQANAGLAPYGATEIPAQSKAQTVQTLQALQDFQELPDEAAANPYIGARPKIVTRRGWGADEGLRESGFRYTGSVKVAFVHHSATGNNHTCDEAPAVLRGIYRYHVRSLGWRDIGYNFAVDKCGTVYEGRAGGITKAVQGAHTLGFNTDSMGIAVLGTFGGTNPPSAAVTAVARLTAWKLGLYGGNPKGTTHLVSGGGNRFQKGTRVRLNVISGHRDGFATECPGKLLYAKLGTARSAAAKYQGRS